MSSSIVTDSIKDAWARARSLLFLDWNVGRWLKYGFIAMLGTGAAGAGGSLNYSPPPAGGDGGGGAPGGFPDIGRVGPEVVDAVRGAVQWIGANLANIVLLALGLVTIWLIACIVLLYVRAVFRFIFVDAVAAPREPGIIVSWGHHTGQGLSLLIWNIFLSLIPLVLLLVAAVPIISSMGLLASGEPLGAVLGVGGMLGLIGVIVFALLVLSMGRALTDDFLVPAMYARRCGVIAGWRYVAGAWEGELGNIVFFYLLKLALGIGAAIVGLLVGLASLIILIVPAVSIAALAAFVALLGLSSQASMVLFGGPLLVATVVGGGTYMYILNVLLLPVKVFFQAYSLAFIGRLDASLRTL